MSEQAKSADVADEEASTERGREAFFGGRYTEAFSQLHSALLNRAIRWFREEGAVFQRPPAQATPTELIIGLAFAAHAEVRERGEGAPHKLETAAALFASIAELRIALESPTPDTPDGVRDKLAEITIRAGMVGQVDMLMTATELGWLDKLAEYEIDRDRRRTGAAVVNARKADAKQTALNEAVRITGKNQTLSNEEVARKVLEATKLRTTIRTATDWVRGWRKGGYLPPQVAT